MIYHTGWYAGESSNLDGKDVLLVRRRDEPVKRYVNLGCGNRFHPDWINIDLGPRAPHVLAHDLRKGIPLPDESCDVVYHAAVLEHIRRADVPGFMRECYRVLRVGGIIRVGVPDLETLCRLYLDKLKAAAAGIGKAAGDYEWVVLEMYDQVVREHSGGEMRAYLQRSSRSNERFVCDRIGEEGRELIRCLRASRKEHPRTHSVLRGLNRRARAILGMVRRAFLVLLAGPDADHALQIGRFRLSGEVHQWMYDRYSLGRLLLESGFREPALRSASESCIPRWTEFHLDTLPDGTPVKPDLLFMEAVKPS